MRALKIVYDEDASTFDQLVDKDKSFCMYHQYIQRLLTEICKALHDYSGNSLKDLLARQEYTINFLSFLNL